MTDQPVKGDELPTPVAVDADAALAQRLKEAREVRQLTQQAVATRSKWADPEGKGISRTALIGYEAGTSRPGARELRILCQTLVVSPNKLLFGTETPARTAHPALEGLDTHKPTIRQAVELAFVLAALKGHERDAIASIALSLAGRQLGDVRLSGLRLTAVAVAGDIERAMLAQLPDGADPASMTLEQIAEAVSMGSGANLGTNLQFDDDLDVVGVPLYPDPRSKA